MTHESSEKGIMFGKYIDFHTHILPDMDDGSASLEMSMQMIRASLRQGVCCIVLTPHFYATKDHPKHFLKKRNDRLNLLKRYCPYSIPLIISGVEVQYFEGITAMHELPQMRIEKSNGLLIEMPTCRWTNRMVNDVIELNSRREYQVILAHAERYLPWENLPLLSQLAEHGVMMQANSGAFKEFGTSRKMLKLLDEGLIHIVGSDSHNITSRPPNLVDAYEIIKKKRGSDAVKQLLKNGIRLLSEQIVPDPAEKEYSL